VSIIAEQEALVSTLLTVFATFTAFGAAVVGFLAAGGVVQTLASGWAEHGKAEALAKRKAKEQRKGLKRARLRSPATIWLAGIFIGLVVVISSLGLIFSFVWLDAYPHGSVANVNWAYVWVIRLFWVEAFLLTLATVFAVVAATASAWTASNSADRSSDLDDGVRTAAVDCLDGIGSAKTIPEEKRDARPGVAADGAG
jgi:hypothetical protein